MLFPAGLDGVLAVPEIPGPLGGRFLPLLAKILTLLGRQFLETLGPAADPFLFFRGKVPEVLVPLANRLFFLGGKPLPPLEPLLSLLPLLRGHALPSFRSPAKAFLLLRRQLIPLASVGSQNLLFFWIQLLPWSGQSYTPGHQGEKDHPQGQDQTIFTHHRLPQFFIPPFFSLKATMLFRSSLRRFRWFPTSGKSPGSDKNLDALGR
jgi:hypothetical protein